LSSGHLTCYYWVAMTGLGDIGIPTYELLATDIEARAECVRNRFDITAVYGWHLTIEQAQEVVEHIDDNSIVFVEGRMCEREYATMRLVQHVLLAGARLEDGGYRENTSESRYALATEFLVRQYSSPTEHDFHSYHLYKGLLDKGCIVLPADYLNLDKHTPPLIPLEDLQEQLSSLFPIESDEALEQAIELDVDLHTKWLHNQGIREQAALNLVLYFLSRYSDAEGLPSLSATQDGKTRAYIIFGLAHRDSLTAYFNDCNIPIERIFVNSGDVPVEELSNLLVEVARTPDERRTIVRNHYLGLLAARQESLELP